jgi:tetraacyldisaccharide 4'-kinase
VVGDGAAADPIVAAAQAKRLPVFHGHLAPDQAAVASFRDRPVLAFAGIGDPEKFFATLAAAGADVRARRAFPDHHRFSAQEAHELIAQAERERLLLVTTEKDAVRLAGQSELGALAAAAQTLPVRLVLQDTERFRAWLLARWAPGTGAT